MRAVFLSLIGILGVTAEAAAAEVIKVDVIGAGEPIIYIPGLASSPAAFEKTAAALAESHEIHLVSIAGFAGMPPVEGEFLPTRIEAIASYVEANDLEGVTVIGHSLGGFLALNMAKELPDTVEAAISIDSLPFLGQLFLRANSAEEAKPGAAFFAKNIRSMNKDAFLAQQQQSVRIQSSNKDAQKRIVSETMKTDRQTMANAMEALLVTDFRDDLEAVKAKITVIYAHSPQSPVSAEQLDAFYAAQYAKAPSVALHRIDNSAHFIMDDQPEKLLAVIQSALD